MNRRRFLKNLTTTVGGMLVVPAASLLLGQRDEFLVSEADICRSGTREWIATSAARANPAALRYEGTHILTHGALREIAAAYRGPVPFVVHGGGCDDGISVVRKGTAELGGLCCPVEGSRAEGLRSVLVARDIKVAVVHPDNPLRDVSFAGLRHVAAGHAMRWRDIGGPDRAIALVLREHCPDYREPARGMLLENRPWPRHALFVKTDKEIVDTVARFPGALGIVSWVFAKRLAEAGALRVLEIDGVPPTAPSVQAGRYPLHGPLNIVFNAWRPSMAPLFEFLYGPEGRAIIAKSLIPVERSEAGYAFG